MVNRIHTIIKLFPQCEVIMDQCKNGTHKAKELLCNNISRSLVKRIDKDIYNICTEAMEFLFKIYLKSENTLIEAGCKYLYTWIYYELKKKENNKYTNSLYDQVTEKYGKEIIGKTYCDEYKKKINDEQMFKLRFLYELYKCHKVMSDISINNTDGDICNPLKDIMNEYKEQITIEYAAVNETTESVMRSSVSVPQYQNNIKAAIITTIIVMLLIFLFIFFVFKFASNSSYFQQNIQRIRNISKNIDSVFPILKQSETNRIISWNNRYNVSYNID
ncbi:variable surface protein [Plasmodium gonderi]|uniref:Variable surface protein n=1 Tax=Plasmodium gonderi TaxID=77519 RepID=A0A1Y1JRJ7_PLAGO|nr:variable surface protein [Plasmodium gonderi]GAW84088.1 variable surface protein [Plasmodium gonderi]